MAILGLLTLMCLVSSKSIHEPRIVYCPYVNGFIKQEPAKVLIAKVTKHYSLDENYARDIVKFVKKNSYKDFPTTKDVLAIIGIESAFNKEAENQGAYGLMQIQYFWFKEYVTSHEELYDPFVNMKLGIFTLREYFLKLNNSREDAVIAYQAGIGNFLIGQYNVDYLNRYREELTRYD